MSLLLYLNIGWNCNYFYGQGYAKIMDSQGQICNDIPVLVFMTGAYACC